MTGHTKRFHSRRQEYTEYKVCVSQAGAQPSRGCASAKIHYSYMLQLRKLGDAIIFATSFRSSISESQTRDFGDDH
jgi:hypothetical protein